MRKIRNSHMDDLALSFREVWHSDKRLLFILLAEVIVNAILPFPNILLAGRIVDSITAGQDIRALFFYVFLLFGCNYLITAISIFLTKTKEYLFIRLTNKLDNDMNRKCLRIDFEKYNDSSVQDRIMMINDAARSNNFFTSLTIFFSIISHMITLVGIVCVMTTLNIWLLLIAAVVIVLQTVLHYARLKYDRKSTEDSINARRYNNYVSRLAKDVQAKKDITIYGMSDYILGKVETFQKAMHRFDRRRIRENGIIEIIAYSLSIAFQVSAYILMGMSAFAGEISIGDFTVGVASLINFMSASSFVTINIITFKDNFVYIRQFKSFLKSRSKYDAKEATVTLKDLDLSHVEFEFRDVSFRYPNSTDFVLKHINLTIRAGEKLAVVGFNGAGKTTFALLLMRMYDPTEGAIYLNGVDIRTIRYEDYQKIFSTVNQDFALLAFSLLENIAITDEASPEERAYISQLLKENDLGHRLKKLYRGLDTPITKILSASGVDLSGGERQKVAVVRALYKNAPALILDEPTSALDPVAEHEIFQKFAEMAQDRTTVLISHRIYSTRFCDRIAVFEKGEIKEYGTFDELIQKQGLYFEFFQQQAEFFQ